jgi:hypothetical protein
MKNSHTIDPYFYVAILPWSWWLCEIFAYVPTCSGCFSARNICESDLRCLYAIFVRSRRRVNSSFVAFVCWAIIFWCFWFGLDWIAGVWSRFCWT